MRDFLSHGRKRLQVNKADTKRYQQLSDMGCIICRKEGKHTPPSIHHINGRTGNGNQETIPLCYSHHQEGSDCEAYTSRHPWKARFIKRYGSESSLLDEVNQIIAGLD